ncbi:PEP-utilizing enzyme [Desulfatiglans anilini]|uniref:PEP-utilizing enzyme n=1 Tax=Desulfatiglans anilini TaxID=90728 RepID=UPI00047F12FB|nr:PEP-utilizing enzyme [Desulfatiglans anilini]
MGENIGGRTALWDALPGYDLIEEVDLPEMHSWFLDATHSVPPWTPLFGWYWIRFCCHGMKVVCDELSIPTCKGWEMRYRDGGSYNAFHIVRDKKEIAERAVKFRQALRPWIDNFDGLWESGKRELLGMYDKLKAVDMENASHVELYRHNYDLMNTYRRMFEIHFLGMYSSYSAWLLLEDLCKERFGMKDQDPEFQDMLRGFNNKVYEMDKSLWDFSQLAVDMGLKDVFVQNKPDDLRAKLEMSEKGREWFRKFMHYLETDEVGGWRMRRMNDLTEPYWLEDPCTPLGVIRNHVQKETADVFGNVHAELSKNREAAVARFLQRVPPPERPFFEGLINLAGKASSYSEEHDLYCELISHALLRRGYLGMGRRLAKSGTIDQPDDIFMLNPDEIDRVLMVPDRHDLRFITRRRRAEWLEWHNRPNPPVITDRSGMEEAVAMDLLPSMDAVAMKIVVGELPEHKPELGADMFGICGCAGEIEGPARVVINYEDLKDVQPGDILVCPGTNPAWTPVYGMVAAVVADRGGTLSHAAIIGREYGVPTIVNTFEGTAKIKTGQRLRIHAAEGAIFILDK